MTVAAASTPGAATPAAAGGSLALSGVEAWRLLLVAGVLLCFGLCLMCSGEQRQALERYRRR